MGLGFGDIAAGLALAPLTGGLSLLGMDEGSLYNVPVIGPLLSENPYADDKIAALRAAAAQYQAYRPQMQDARLDALQQSLGQLGGTSQMASMMTGMPTGPAPYNPFLPPQGGSGWNPMDYAGPPDPHAPQPQPSAPQPQPSAPPPGPLSESPFTLVWDHQPSAPPPGPPSESPFTLARDHRMGGR